MGTKTRPGRTVAVLLLAVAAFALSQTAVIPAISAIARDRQVSIDAATWVLTAYLISAAVMTPLLGRLSDLFGSRRLLVVTLMVFTAGALTAAASTSLAGLVVGRALQGAGGAVLPICYGIARRSIPGERRAVAIGVLTGTMSVGGGAGLIAGGMIVDHASYRWIFLMAAGMGGLSMLLVRLLVPALAGLGEGRMDVAGTVLLAVGIGAGLLALSQSGQPGATTVLLALVAVAGLAVFALVESRITAPVVHLPTFTTGPVLAANTIALLAGYATFTLFVVVPQLTTIPRASGYGLGQSAFTGALILVPGTLAMLVIAPLSGHLARRWTPEVPLVIGATAAAIGHLGLAVDHGGLANVALWSVVGFTGLGQVLATLPNLILDTVPAHRVGATTGVNGLMRLIGGAAGSQAAALIVARAGTDQRSWPAEAGFVTALTIGGGVSVVAAMIAAAAPLLRTTRRRWRERRPRRGRRPAAG